MRLVPALVLCERASLSDVADGRRKGRTFIPAPKRLPNASGAPRFN